MEISFTPENLAGTMHIIPSKSSAHRILIAAALAEAPTTLRLLATSQDIDATGRCLGALGARLVWRQEELTVWPIPRHLDAVPLLDCGESGSTLRFMLPVAAALCPRVELTALPGLAARPMQPLLDCLAAHGVACTDTKLPLATSGMLRPGLFVLPGDVSSQYITGLLFALPLLAEQSEIRLTTLLQSAGYVEMTLDTLAQFGIAVQPTATGYLVPGGQQYRSPGQAVVEGDWSNAAFWLAAGALSGPVTVTGLSAHSLQRDRQIVELLGQFGADVTQGPAGITVAHRPLRGIAVNVRDIPDLLPILAVVAAFAAGDTTFTHAQRLRLKESDRLATVQALLEGLGVRVETTPDSMTVHGTGTPPPGGRADSANDHRIAMAAAVAAAHCTGPVTLVNPMAVNKSYPDFYKDYQQLGGTTHVVNLR